jgi:outer membrane receptor protein involved in Fe transport
VWVVGVAIALAAPAALAAQTSPAAPAGRLVLILFAAGDGGAVPGAVVTVLGGPDDAPGVSAATNADGAVRFTLPPGSYRLAVVPGAAAGPPVVTPARVPVAGGEATEVLATLGADGAAPQVRVETAVALGPAGDEADGAAAGAAGLGTGPLGTLRGTARHVETGRPVAGARVFVRGAPVEARSDAEGRFALEVPAGTHDVTVIHPEFGTATFREIPVPPDRPASGAADAEGDVGEPLLVELTPLGVELAPLSVTAPRIEGSAVDLLQERRAAGVVTDLIGAEQMARTGDSDAAAALKRVTGVSVVGGKYVYVRGLGERYSSTLLNGSTLPSPEPERRVVPLDMFPADLLESVVVQKGYTPDLPGEFAGGAVLLRTRGYPEQFTLSVGGKLGATLGTTFAPGLHGPGGPTDFLGVDGGFRALPGPVAAASRDRPLLEADMFSERGYQAAELERLGERLPNRWDPHRATVWPDLGLDAVVGDSFDLWGARAGFLVGLTYDSEWQARERRVDIFTLGSGGRLEPAHRYAFEELERTVVLAGILDWGVDLSPDHRVRLTTLVDRITSDEARSYEGFNRDVGTRIRVTRLRWVERMLLTQQVRGEHRFPGAIDVGQGLALDWRYTFSRATRDEPDRREVRSDNERGTDRWLLSDRPEGNQRVFSALEDVNHDAGVDVTVPFRQWTGEEAHVKAGAALAVKDRAVDTRRYKFLHKGPRSGDPAVLAGSAEEIFTPENIGPDGFQFEEITRQTDNYSASQRTAAGYALVDLPLGAGLRLLAGLRAEWASQRVTTFELFNPAFEPVVAELDTLDWLPAATLSWAFGPDMLLRAGYSRTVSRPDFRELSPATFNDVTGGRQVFGNPDMQRAVIHGADLRWEWYLTESESLSLGAFYKRFEDPIETVVVVSAQHSVTHANAAGADNVGIELEFTKSLGLIHPILSDLYVQGNATWIWSRILLPDGGIQTSKQRPLQGQSPFLVNLTLGYENVDWLTSLALVYHVFGRRIEEVGALGAPDVYEEPVHQLDLVWRQGLGGGFRLSFKATNLLDPAVRRTQGGHTTETYRRGRGLDLGLSWSW